MHKNLIIYCDESADKGKYYSHFYGGALIDASQRQSITEKLNAKKEELNLYKELKWTYITQQYQEKYIQFIDEYFDYIDQSLIKIRIMFSQNRYEAVGLEEYQLDNQYFLLYYQLIKHAFGLRYCNNGQYDLVNVHLYLDDIPDTKEKFLQFKNYLSGLSHFPVFTRGKVSIEQQNITDVRSHDHVILQGLDIILGAMQFRLNDKHKIKPEGSRSRGKRTRAKEAVYKHIRSRIIQLRPNFNIGITTGQSTASDRWDHPYRHWNFIPSEHKINEARTKANGRPAKN